MHGSGAGAVAYAIGTASNLVLLPLYLRAWSVAVYGEWMALYSFVLYLANLDFGVTAAAINAATMAHARGDWDEFKRVQGTAWTAALGIAAAGGAVVLLPLLICFRIERLLNLTAMPPRDARIVFCCLGVSLLANIPGRQLISIYISIGEFATYQWLYNAFLAASSTSIAVSLIAGAGPALAAAVMMSTALFTIAVAAYLLRRRDPRLLPRIAAADWATARTLAAPTSQFGLSLIASALTIQGPVVLLSRSLGGTAVAVFTTTRTVANVIKQTTTLINAPLRPELAGLAARREGVALGRLFRVALGLSAVTGLSAFAALWSFGGELIRFWSRGRVEPSADFLHLLLVSVLLQAFLLSLSATGWAINRMQSLALAQFGVAVGSLVLAIALIRTLGLLAVPVGSIVCLLAIMAPAAIRDASRHVHLPPPFIAGRILMPFAAVGLMPVASCALMRSAPQSGWLLPIATPFLAASFAVALTAGVFLTREDRLFLYSRLRGALHRA